ncbi:hypothetical protein AB0M11_35935 [Streptomyces sp. NPDC051987]|uniref:hypothetical protein n=1 Tax=Streptomyces sp. NPDC051987 TaxID=3155808 RepID=UPI0034466452
MDDQYVQVGDDGRLTLIPGQEDLRDVLYFKDPDNTATFEKADYLWLARVVVMVQAGGGRSGRFPCDRGPVGAQPGGSGGGYSERLIDVAALGATESITAGAGGDAGTPTVDGGDGDAGNSSFGGLCTALGDKGGQSVMVSGATPVCRTGTSGPTGRRR